MRLPKELMDDVADYQKKNPQLGFSTKAEIVKTAIREYLQKNNGDGEENDSPENNGGSPQ